MPKKLKRCLSASDLPDPDDTECEVDQRGRKRYRGRYSLQKSPVVPSPGGVKSRSKRQRSPKRFDLLEELDEYAYLHRRPSPANLELLSQRRGNPSQSNPPPTIPLTKPKSEEFTAFLREQVVLLGQHTNSSSEGRSPHDTTIHLTLPTQTSSTFNKDGRINGEALWLHLGSYFAGRPMDRQHISLSLGAQDKQLKRLRNERSSVLTDILNFRLPSPPPTLAGVNSSLELVYDPSCSEHFCQCISGVEELLGRFELFEQLYPTRSAMCRDNTGVWDSTLESALTTLRVWYNTASDLLEKINAVGDYLDIIEGCKHQALRSSKPSVSASPTSPTTSPVPDRPTHGPGTENNTQTLWPSQFFCAKAIADRLSRSASSHSANGSASTKIHSSTPTDLHSPHSESFMEIYHKVVGRSLRLRGMITVLKRLQTLCGTSLEKSVLTLLAPRKYAQIAGASEAGRYLSSLRKKYEWRNEPATFNEAWTERMNLPTIYPYFIFLARIPVDLIHQWLKMRAERVISPEWDILTLNTLVEDCHDCLQTAIEVKQRFIWLVELSTNRAGEQLSCLENFDDKLGKIFMNYLGYARCWAQTALTKQCTEAGCCERVANKLVSEWVSAKLWSVNVNRGEIMAARRFCEIGSDLLNSMVLNYMDEKFDLVDARLVDIRLEDDYILIEDGETLKHSSVYLLCRNFKEMVREMRARLLASLGYVHRLCSDLEICAKYTWEHTVETEPASVGDELLDRLLDCGYIIVQFLNHFDPQANEECQFFVLCSREIVNDFIRIDSLLNATYRSSLREPHSEGSGGHLLLIPRRWSSRRMESFSNHMVAMKLSFVTKCTLAHYITADGIYLISENCDTLERNRERFENGPAGSSFIASGKLRLVDDFCSCNDELSTAIATLKSLAFKTIHEAWTHARGLGHFVLNGRKIGDLKELERNCLRATLLQAWEAVFECYRELSGIVSLRHHRQFHAEITEIVLEWSVFFTETANESRHVPLRWAATSLKSLSEMPSRLFQSVLVPTAEKEVLFDALHCCIDHLQRIHRIEEDQERDSKTEHPRFPHSMSAPTNTSTAPLSPPDHHHLAAGLGSMSLGSLNWKRRESTVASRIVREVSLLDHKREDMLRGLRRIGRVVETKHTKDFNSYFHPHKMRVPFEWQRLENKELGAGSFGKVFLVMTTTGDKQLMAMKEVRVQRENQSALKALVDEVDIFRQLDHPNLVHYYGVEVHKEEIFIFMEYCSEGTLLRVCKESLDIDCVRRYTHYLLLAITYLHDHNIVHRDIKPENIFLTQDGSLKLGDFGCSLRLKDSKTQMGELVHHIGTIRYMAPEIQTNGGLADAAPRGQFSEHEDDECAYIGYGRSVDVWSLGCVVLEMLTGKKPYHEMNNDFQIIYHIGSGNAPRIPENIKKCLMSRPFLEAVFRINPQERPTARELLSHRFANIITTSELGGALSGDLQ